MHKIEETSYGYLMTFEGFFQREDIEKWVRDVGKEVGGRGSFGVLVEMRGAAAFPVQAQEMLFEGIQLCREKGMDRAAVVVANPISKIQAVRISKETGIQDIVKFVDASSETEWEQVATDWIQKGIQPG